MAVDGSVAYDDEFCGDRNAIDGGCDVGATLVALLIVHVHSCTYLKPILYHLLHITYSSYYVLIML